MMRTTAALAYLKRTFRPTYAFTQSTPKSQYLDPAWDRSVPIYPGMVAQKGVGELVTLIGTTGTPYGFFGNWIGGSGIDELLETGINACGVWVLSADAEAEVMAPAFDDSQTWAEPTDGTIALIYAQTTGANRGKLVPAGTAGASAAPVARLIKVVSTSKIVIGGLRGNNG
jgi:hypothetical protein